MKANLFKILFGVIIGIAIMFLFRGCSSSYIPDVTTSIRTIHNTDTVYSHSADTVYTEGPKQYVYLDSPTEEHKGYTIHSYDEDDLKADVITYNNGSQEIDYQVVCPIITNTDSIIVTNTDSVFITKTLQAEGRHKLFLGSSVAIADKNVDGVSLNLTWQMKSDLQIYYEYGAMFNSNDQHRFGVKIPLKRKKMISL